jgi:ParB family transcriptional regulator, chromosome partitioning protein
VSEAASSKRGLPVRVKMRHTSHFVDELTSRHEAGVGSLVPLSALKANPNQPRSEMGDLGDLVASIRDKGVLEPILVRKAPAPEHSEPASRAVYTIVAGERRYRAALEAGLFEVPVIVLDVSEEEALEIALIENIQRRDLSAFEEAEAYKALGELHGYTQEKIAKAVGKARSTVAETLSLLEIPSDLRERALALGVRSRSALLAIAKIGDSAEMKDAIEEAARLGLNRDDLRRSPRQEKKQRQGGRKKPYVFKFRSPDRKYSLSLSFRQSEVERDDLIRAIEQILAELRDKKSN